MEKTTDNIVSLASWFKYIICAILFLLFFFLIQACNSGSGSGTSSSGSTIKLVDRVEYDQEKAAAAISEVLEGEEWEKELSSSLLSEKVRDTLVSLVKEFYQEKNFQPQWNREERGEVTDNFLEELSSLPTLGLDSSDYPVEKLREEVEKIYSENEVDYQNLAKTEVALTANYFLLARQIGKGRIEGGGNTWMTGILNPEKWIK